jgi:hypothetical protein
MQMIIYAMPPETKVSITHFVPDGKKNGGFCLISSGHITKYNIYDKKIVLSGITEILVDNIIDVSFENSTYSG